MAQLASVLIVDDDNIHQAVTKAMLKKMGYPVLAAYDGAQAISTFEEHEKSIGWVLLDIHMPNMNGIEVLQHLRKVKKDVQVIIVSGYINKAKQEELESLQPRTYLQKPLDYQLLFEELAKPCKPVENSES